MDLVILENGFGHFWSWFVYFWKMLLILSFLFEVISEENVVEWKIPVTIQESDNGILIRLQKLASYY